MKNYRNLSSVIRSVVTEAHTKDHPPFEPDEKSSFKKQDNKNRTGMDAAKALARRAMQQKMKESFDLDISEEEADDLLNSIQESKWVDEYNFTPADHEKAAADHEKAAAKHERTAAGHLEDAKKHKSAGRNLEFHASMRGYHKSLTDHHNSLTDHHDSMERSHLLAAKPLFRGTGSS